MKKILNAYKPKGLTPLEVIRLIRQKYPSLKDEKIGYAGRLDPLAHGVLLLMIGDETKQRDKYLNLPKEYEFEAVFGVSTDTYDALGILQTSNCHPEFISGSHTKKILKQVQHDINMFIKSKLGKQTQTYPPFSSKTVQGKPLYWWSRNHRLSEIKIPTRKIEVYNFELLEMKQVSAAKLKKEIIQQIDSVTGDFRQKEIKEKWERFFATNYPLPTTYQTARFKISCSSGTYIRSIMNELGEKLDCGAITLEILRTKVGDYDLKNSTKLF